MDMIIVHSYILSKTLYPEDMDLLEYEVVVVKLLIGHFFLNWDSLHARLNSHYEAWSYKKRSTKRITGYSKSV